jgi:uncharacterized protein (DUF1499 family)
MPRRRVALGALAAMAVTLVVLLLLPACADPRAAGVDPASGGLAACPGSPNCVCSTPHAESPADAAIAPLAYRGTRADAHRRLLAALAQEPRTTVVSDDGAYIHAICTSLIFRFVDDVELLIDEARQRVEVRSLSRVGYSDLGVNRRRVERLRAAFDAQP